MTDISAKSRSLVERIDWSRPELADVSAAPDRAAAFVRYLETSTRARLWFEPERKAEILAHLDAHYAFWRAQSVKRAARMEAIPLERITDARCTTDMAQVGLAWWSDGASRHAESFQRIHLSLLTRGAFNWGNFISHQADIDLSAYLFLRDCPAYSVEGKIAFFDHLMAICDESWDANVAHWGQLMLGPEGHNWYLHGIKGAFTVGVAYPEFARSAFFVRTAASLLEEHMRAHYHADGGARETSFHYQEGSLFNLWEYYLIARRNGLPVAPWYADKALSATLFLLRLMTPNGRPPSFGDCASDHPGGLSRLAAIAAALTGDRECKWYAEYCRQSLPEEANGSPDSIPYAAFWDVGLEGARAYSAVRARNPHHASVFMPDTGYATMRDNDTLTANHLTVVACERGPIVTSHGHTDIFSLEVHAGGLQFLGEPGCVNYGTTPGRNYDQKTEAHTCLVVDSEDQVPIVNEWRWSGSVCPHVRRWISEPTHDFFHGVHEGYCRLDKAGLIHARKIFFAKALPGGRPYWIVLDRLLAGTEHDYTAYFHGVRAGDIVDNQVVIGENSAQHLAILSADALAPERVKSAGLSAFCSERSIPEAEYPCFAFHTRAQDCCLGFGLIPLAPGERAPHIEAVSVSVNGTTVTPAEAYALRLDFGDHVDWLCVSHKDFDADLVFGPHHAWGHCAFRREQQGAILATCEHAMADGDADN